MPAAPQTRGVEPVQGVVLAIVTPGPMFDVPRRVGREATGVGGGRTGGTDAAAALRRRHLSRASGRGRRLKTEILSDSRATLPGQTRADSLRRRTALDSASPASSSASSSSSSS